MYGNSSISMYKPNKGGLNKCAPIIVPKIINLFIRNCLRTYKMSEIHNDFLLSHIQKYCGIIRWTETGEQLLKMSQEVIKETQNIHDSVLALPEDVHSFDEVVLPKAHNSIKFTDTSSYIGFFQYISSDEPQREASFKAENQLLDFTVSLSMDKPMFDKLSQCQAANPRLRGEEKRLLDRTILDGRRFGLHLNKVVRAEVETLTKKINSLCTRFNNNILKENTLLTFDVQQLDGVPRDFIDSLDIDDEDERIITLKYPHVIPIMKYCTVESTRKTVDFHFNSRCIQDNVRILEKIARLRHKRAVLLNYQNHSVYTIETLMAKSLNQVHLFLDLLVDKLTSLQETEYSRLLNLKQIDCCKRLLIYDNKINSWDYTFYINLVEKLDYNIDHNQVKEYLNFDEVQHKILHLYQEILQLVFVKVDKAPTWHPDVKLYAVIENHKGPEKGQILGYFYLDLFPRPFKYSHAACFTIQHRCQLPNGEYQPGVSAMVANFTKPFNDKPCLFTHSEVETFFHEFGHVMHSLCSTNRFVLFSGTQVERDFVEAPSQMLENWVWSPTILKYITSHYVSHEPMPDQLIKRLIGSKKANAALFYLRQIAFAKLDLAIHSKANADSSKEIQHAFVKYWGIKPQEGTNFAASFGHLAGGYDARYYGYLWSQVYSADMYFERFVRNPRDPINGLWYRNTILAPGGSIDGLEMLRNFLGRDPSQAAFLHDLGLY